MAKRIIILDRVNIPSDMDFNYVLWVDVPASRQEFYANPNAKSLFKQASAAELTAIQSGAIVEMQGILRSVAGQTIAQIQTQLIAAFNAFQTHVTNDNSFVRYGTYWDGTSWTSVTVA